MTVSAGIDGVGGSYDSATAGTVGLLIANAASVRSQLDALTRKVSSGKNAATYGGLGSSTGMALQMRTEIAHNDVWVRNIDSATGRMNVAQSALSQISAIASSFYAQTNNLNGLNASEIDSIAASARSALRDVTAFLDSKFGDVYVFAGQDSSQAPLPNPDAIWQSGFTTAISAAVSALGANGAAATVANTLSIASSNAAPLSPFSASLSQPAATLTASRPSIQVGQGQFVPVGIVASANGDAPSAGTSTTGSYIRDIMRGLATLGSLSSGQASVPGFSQLVLDTRTSLGDAISALNVDAGALGDRQTQLSDSKATLGTVSTTLQAQLSSIEDTDMATSLSELSSVQNRLQASYQLIASIQSLSLTRFLSTGG
ncbi:flagellin [Rhodovastum sp. RN2-1]|uniref:Flagellin n=2 Tax=Limobrevibacterium gyesilva TaxID=2991712 RepID=A0AA41YPQ6_9PROT|nr:flagellin [Limobrevibacterium gyesilva]